MLNDSYVYIATSILSTSFHKTSKWVFQLLTKFELRPKAKETPLRVLEVRSLYAIRLLIKKIQFL